TFVTAGADAQAFDLHDGSTVGTSCVHEGLVAAVAVSPDGQTIATAGQDATARLWEAPTRQPPPGRTIDMHLSVPSLAYSQTPIPSSSPRRTATCRHTTRLTCDCGRTGRPTTRS